MVEWCRLQLQDGRTITQVPPLCANPVHQVHRSRLLPISQQQMADVSNLPPLVRSAHYATAVESHERPAPLEPCLNGRASCGGPGPTRTGNLRECVAYSLAHHTQPPDLLAFQVVKLSAALPIELLDQNETYCHHE